MMYSFINTSKIQKLEFAFKSVLDARTIKTGEYLLNNLRKQRQFQLLIALFILRSIDNNLKMLAILELQKIKKITLEQTVWSLKELFFKSTVKISNIICRIMSDPSNLEMSKEFLKCRFREMGTMQTQRQLNFLLNLLTKNKVRKLIQIFDYQIWQNLTELMSLSEESAELTQMTMICTALYFDLKIMCSNSFEVSAEIQHYYSQIKNLIQNRSLTSISYIMMKTITKMVEAKEQSLNEKSVMNFFISILTESDKKYQKKGFLVKSLQLFINNNPNLFSNLNNIEEYLQVCYCKILQEVKQNTHLMKLRHSIFDEILDDQLLKLVSYLNQKLVNQYYRQLVSQQLKNKYEFIQEYYFKCLTFLLYCKGCLNKEIQSFINQVAEVMVQSILQNQQISDQLSFKSERFILFGHFIIKYKQILSKLLLYQCVRIFSQFSVSHSQLASICYLVLDETGENLINLPLLNLYKLIQYHIVNLNNSYWSHNLDSYINFFKLILEAEKRHSFLIKKSTNHIFYVQIIKSFLIIFDLINETDQNIDFDTIITIVNLFSSILPYRQIFNIDGFKQVLQTVLLLINKYQIFKKQSGKIIAFQIFYFGNFNHFLNKIKNQATYLSKQNCLCNIQICLNLITYLLIDEKIEECKQLRQTLRHHIMLFFSFEPEIQLYKETKYLLKIYRQEQLLQDRKQSESRIVETEAMECQM